MITTHDDVLNGLLALSDQMRVWIYAANRPLSEGEAEHVRKSSAAFLENWQSHGRQMNARIFILHQQFIIVLADEQAFTTSGCAIDSSVRFIKSLEDDLKLNLFDRMLVSYRDDEGTVQTVSFTEFSALAKDGLVSEDTIVFDHTVGTLGQLKTRWEVPASSSWHARLLE